MTERLVRCIKCGQDFSSSLPDDDLVDEGQTCDPCRISETVYQFFAQKKDKILVTNFVNEQFVQGKVSKEIAEKWIAHIWMND